MLTQVKIALIVGGISIGIGIGSIITMIVHLRKVTGITVTYTNMDDVAVYPGKIKFRTPPTNNTESVTNL